MSIIPPAPAASTAEGGAAEQAPTFAGDPVGRVEPITTAGRSPQLRQRFGRSLSLPCLGEAGEPLRRGDTVEPGDLLAPHLQHDGAEELIAEREEDGEIGSAHVRTPVT